MKKYMRCIAMLIAMVMMLSACKKVVETPTVEVDESRDEKVNVQEPDEKSEAEEETEVETTNNDSGDNTDDDNQPPKEKPEGGWDVTYEDLISSIPYEAPVYEVEPQTLSIKEQYDQMVNKDQVTGFTDKQQQMLEDQGFVVMQLSEEHPYLKMHNIYEMSEYDDIPMFISSDIILHMYNLYYSKSMKYLELTEYSRSLRALCLRLNEQAAEAYADSSEAVKEDLKVVYAYIAVGNILINGVGSPSRIEALPQEIKDMVVDELNNIEAQEYTQSLLYNKKIDYSQYKVRGHYVGNDRLEAYFKSMMWLSQAGFQMVEPMSGSQEITVEDIDFSQLRRSLMLTQLLFDDARNVEDWEKIYQMTSLYSGNSDDVTFFDMKDLIDNVYGEERGYEAYVDQVKYNEQLIEAMNNLKLPRINDKIGDEGKGLVDLQFRFMGQRYTLDGEVMQNLMNPPERSMPTAFDVLASFGHSSAEEVLYEHYDTNQNWPEYDQTLTEMKEVVKNYEGWQDNLYSGFLWSIDAAATSYEDKENYPEFMKTKAWSYKNLASALGSYTELKHSNILYSKQPMAEKGGPEYVGEHHYVEPNIELYSRLLWLTQYTQASLEKSNIVEEELINPLSQMEETLETLISVSTKELAGETVSEEEFIKLSYIGGMVDYFTVMWSETISDGDKRETDALVVDVATVIGEGYLEEGIGLPREIYVVCMVNGKSFLAKGSVFSYYEFVSQERLTDDQWNSAIGLEGKDIGFEGYMPLAYMGTDMDQLEMMPWMSLFMSDEPNNTEVNQIEVNWRN